MARFPRSLLDGVTSHFHVICRGNNRGKLFLEAGDFAEFHRLMCKARIQWPFAVHHYVFMTTHVHFLCSVDEVAQLSRAFHWVQFVYCQYYQRKYPSIGHLWHSRFRSVPIMAESHLLRCARYIEVNPIAAGLAERVEEYPWSSYYRYAAGRPDALVTQSPWFLSLGEDDAERECAYAAYVGAGVGASSADDVRLFERRPEELSTGRRCPKWSAS